MSQPLDVRFLGQTPYQTALELQRTLAADRIAGKLDRDVLLLLEHPPVITLGRLSDETNLRDLRQGADSLGIEIHEIERGGDVTYHGPGQLVGYPILDLSGHRTDLHWYLRQLEETLILALRSLGVEGNRQDGLTGVWVQNRKVASIGIHVKQWVTWHGFALNVNTDLSYFDLIIPCGIPDVVMTSVAREVDGRSAAELWGSTIAEVTRAFESVFDMVADPVESNPMG